MIYVILHFLPLLKLKFHGILLCVLLDSLKSSFQSSSFRLFPLSSLCHHSLFFFFVPVFGGRSALNISLGVISEVFSVVSSFFGDMLRTFYFLGTRGTLAHFYLFPSDPSKISLYNRYLFFPLNKTIRFKMV